MPNGHSLVRSLLSLIDGQGDWPLYQFLESGDWDGPRTSRTAVELDAHARRIAGALQAAGLAGKPVVLLYPPGMAFIDAFYGCLYAGAIAVPVWPPDLSRLARTLPRLVAIAADAEAAAVLTTSEIAPLAEGMGELAPALAALPWIATDALEAPPAFVDRGHGEVAFLQYTSGSTGDPKGVIVTHQNLAANIRAIGEAYRLRPGETVVSWLPQYHDMGLIGNILAPGPQRMTAVLLSPTDFLRRPFRWVDAVSRSGAIVTGGPDFGWALVARKITDAEVASLDLSRLRVAYSGAEPVRPETLSAVEKRLGPAGFSRAAWQPVYGLAEGTLIVSGGIPAEGRPVERRLDPAGLSEGVAREGERPMVGCGRAVDGLSIQIANGSRAAVDGAIGEILVSGSSVAQGYWRKPELSREVFERRLEGDERAWLATGDLGFLHQGELFVTGRLKDLLIVRGRNLYPQDLEASAIAAHPAVRQGCVAAFAHERDGQELVGVAAEIDPGRATEGPEQIVAAIRTALAEQHDVVVDPILLLEPRGLPKTSSGKVQRKATREAWLDGSLPVLHLGAAATRAKVSTEDPLLRRLIREIAAWTGQPEHAIDPELPLRSLGLDSLRLVELANLAEQASGVRVEMAAVYDHPTLSALVAYVRGAAPSVSAKAPEVPVAPARSATPRIGPDAYPGLAEGRRRLDARGTGYQYDLERDIAWDTFDAPGTYVTPELLAGFGFDLEALKNDPESAALVQWGMALSICEVFERLEIGLIRFVEDNAAQVGAGRSLELFVSEEHKHIATFRRFRERLEAARPGDVAAFREAFKPSLELLSRLDPDPVGSSMQANPSLTVVEAHYLGWLQATLFEAYTVWLYDALAASPAGGVQPLWLRLHELHRQEEVQHLVTDAVHLRHVGVSAERRRELSAAFCALVVRDFDHFFGVDSVFRLVRARRGKDVRNQDPLRVPKAVQSVLGIPVLGRLRKEAPFVETAIGLPPERLVPEALEAARPSAVKPAPKPDEPEDGDAVAIVGIGCRYPGGARDPKAFFQQLLSGTDAIREVPKSRWDVDALYDPNPDAVGKMNTRWGGFIDGIEDFDPLFFSVAPREARAMDPQQRVLLEVTWEALEDAGIPPSALLGQPAGVFVGISSWDYSRRPVLAPVGPWSATGVALSIASGRISYLLGLTGPCLSVDTACSSSLVALHLAVKSLRSGECPVALVGGVQLLLYAETTVGFSKLRAMSPTGRCRTFDASADGYVRSDGCGVVVLKRLADARRDGDRIYAVIHGTAMNQDGRSNGLTAPNGLAQQAVIRSALADAKLEVNDLGYLEAHGTGTPLGDPIELGAIGAVAKGRSEPLWIGSVKSAIGHSEAASGLAGVIKTALSIHNGVLPPNLHFKNPTPHVPWAELPIRVPTEPVEWPAGPKFAGVNSFGFGGTNAHVILGEAPREFLPAAAPTGLRFLALSAPDDAGVAAVAGRLRAHLAAHPDANLDDVAHTTLVGRTAFPRRAAVLAPDREAALAGLAALEAGQPGQVGPSTARENLRVGFLFTGQGAQYAGMGKTLATVSPVFRDSLERSSKILGSRLGKPLLQLLEDPTAIDQTGVTQPAMIAIALALAETWKSLGVEPALVMGHSVGEIAAAAVAGVFDLEGALTLIEARARLMQALPRDGAMVAVETDEATALAALGPDAERVSIAVINSQSQVVLSGDTARVQAVVARLEAKAGRALSKRLQVSHAFHSPLMEPMLDELEQALRGVRMKRPSLPLVSNVTGALAGAEVARPGYWSMHVRAPVRFAAGLKIAVDQGINAFIELGPHPTLLALAGAAFPGMLLLPSLRRGQDDRQVFARSVASLWAAGGRIDAGAVAPGRRIALPTWPFARQRYWQEEAPEGSVSGDLAGHPLLGRRLDLAGPVVFETTLSKESHALLAEHQLEGTPVFPAAGWAELARAAAAEAGRGDVLIEELQIEDALRWPEPVRLQTVVDGAKVTISARRPEGWRVHARASARLLAASVPPPVSLAEIAAPDAASVDYEAFEAAGLGYGPSFRGLTSLRVGEGVAVGEIVVPEAVRKARGYGLHPAILDAAFQACSALMTEVGLALPVGFARLTLDRAVTGATLAVVVRAAGSDPTTRRFDLDLCEQDGRRIARIEGLSLRIVRQATGRRAASEALQTTWERLPQSSVRPAAVRRRVLGETPLAEAVRAEFGGEPAGEGARVDELVFLAEGRGLAEGLDALLAASATEPDRLLVVTTGAFAIDGDPLADPATMAAQRGMWGFGRSVALERPGRVRLIDLDPALTPAERAAALVEESATVDAEDQVARRGTKRLGARVTPVGVKLLAAPRGGFQLKAATRGSADNLALVPVEEPAPGPGQVRIAVEAAGLNFRDVLNVLGVVPGDPGLLGGECAGRIEAVGPGVEGLRVGDEVVAMVGGTFARSVLSDARLVAPRPRGWTSVEAATLPVAFTTAWYGLYDLAGLKEGQVALIHAVAGGVGLAALQLARRVGARVFGTASASKQAIALAHGAEKVASSREPGFSRVFGEQVDVVLNSLTGAFIMESLRALKPGGVFLEMGKAEIWSEEKAAGVNPHVPYRPFDLATMSIDELSRLLKVVVAAADRGELKPLPLSCFPFARSVEAFRHMAAAKHVGKVVLTRSALSEPEKGTWIVTGGTGAVGGALARELGALGVRRVVLVARRVEGPAVATLLGSLRESGIDATAVAADVSQPEGLEKLATVAGEVAGIIHAAGVLDDGLAKDLTPERVRAVRSPKADAALLLAARWPKARFVAISSVAAALGSPGQASYAAANGALDGLVTALAAGGRHARSIQYGPWAGAGMAAATRARHAAQGMVPLEPTDAARWLGSALDSELPVLTALTLDRKRLAARLGGQVPPLLSGLGLGPVAPAGKSLAAELAAVPPAEQRAKLLLWLQQAVGRVVGARAEAIDAHRPLRDFGLDSLMAVELQTRLATELARDLPRTLLVDHPTLDSLTGFLVGAASPAAIPAPRPVAPPKAEALPVGDVGAALAALEAVLGPEAP